MLESSEGDSYPPLTPTNWRFLWLTSGSAGSSFLFVAKEALPAPSAACESCDAAAGLVGFLSVVSWAAGTGFSGCTTEAAAGRGLTEEGSVILGAPVQLRSVMLIFLAVCTLPVVAVGSGHMVSTTS